MKYKFKIVQLFPVHQFYNLHVDLLSRIESFCIAAAIEMKILICTNYVRRRRRFVIDNWHFIAVRKNGNYAQLNSLLS